ncbi:MAG: hypothetical protein M3347_00185 [Armatimonadota bacterium]|nr:hypothetical protein [Armatimonadota bacterium]
MGIASAFALPTPAPKKTMKPIALHPANPHYFLFRGQPAVLITSGEHYGAVLNLEFDYIPYLDELKAKGLNLTRTFSGTYREVPGNFGIQGNTLAPAPQRFICPWARSDTPGYAQGGNKFDLTRWDDAYFARLKDFVREAGARGIVVELVLFCPLYEDSMWNASPMKASNNVNGIGDVPRNEVLTLKHPTLVAVQDAVTHKIVSELKEFDNLYYEICNEPYIGGVTLEWQQHIAATIVAAEKDFPAQHLIAQNIANGSAKIDQPNPHVSIFNFHYAFPPDAVRQNYGLNTVIAFDESGFRGSGDKEYRTEAWEFIIAGGAVYDNLDYSFTVDKENGTAAVKAPGGGGPNLRQQLKILKEFIHSFDFLKMQPDQVAIRSKLDGASARALAEPGRAYAIYLRGGQQTEVSLELPAGSYKAEWINTKTGQTEKSEEFRHEGGSRSLSVPPYAEDIALRIKKKS